MFPLGNIARTSERVALQRTENASSLEVIIRRRRGHACALNRALLVV